jgi:ATP phosphoribosyltransferase regulatory subunit
VEIDQLGVELLGEVDACATAEVARLAIESLRAVGPAYVLDVSHMGFASGLFAAAGLSPDTQELLNGFIRQKNGHELAQALAEAGVPASFAERIEALLTLAGAFPETLAAAKALCVSADMEAALNELAALHAALTAAGLAGNVRLDFSMLNDQSYYNGVVFQGYVEGAPRVVLSGGRYDPLMRRFGKAGDAIGFAMYLDELDRVLADSRAWDADVLALYRAGDDAAKVSAAVFALAAQGLKVFAAKSTPADFRAARTLFFNGEAFEEVGQNA